MFDFNPDNLNVVVTYYQVKTLLTLGVRASEYTEIAINELDSTARILWDVVQNHLWCVRGDYYGTAISDEVFEIALKLPTKEERLIYLSALYT